MLAWRLKAVRGADCHWTIPFSVIYTGFNQAYSGLVPFRLQAIRLRAITPTGSVSPTVSLNWICMRVRAHAACVRAIALVPRACSCVLVDIWMVPASASLLTLSSVAKMIILSTPTPSSASRNCVPLKVCVHSPVKVYICS